MNANGLELWVKHFGLTVMILLFSVMSAPVAGGCENSAGRLERVAVRAPTVEVDMAATDSAPSVPAKIPQVTPDQDSISAYLAVHCEAGSNLLLGQAARAFGPACGANPVGSALQ